MARTVRLVRALRTTARRLRTGVDYQWGHFGMCNCGHLAQTLTERSRAEIHRAAVERARDWGDAAVEYCPDSGLPIDAIIDEMLAAGLAPQDLRHLERLSDRRVLRRLPSDIRHLERNRRDHLVLYLETWAELLEEQLEAEPLQRAAE
jgi:hypothetical protein